MSCSAIHNRSNINYENVSPYGDKSNTLATLDIAFNQSGQMNDFQNKMENQITNNNIPNINDNINNNINDNIQSMLGKENNGFLLSSQSEEKLDNNVEEMLGAYYNKDILKQNETPLIPLIRNQPYSPYNSKLSEKFNLQQNAGQLWTDTNTTSYNATGMSFLKFLILIVLIVILIYCIYWLYRNNKYKKNVSTSL